MFNYLSPKSIVFLACSILLSQAVQANEDSPPQAMTSIECLQDLDFTAKFLLENDAGIQAKNWTAYPENIQKILDAQNEKTIQVKTIQECKDIAKPFLNTIRTGHIGLSNKSVYSDIQKNATPQQDDLVTTKKLSEQTTYIFVPSFGISIKDQLEKIIKNNQDNLLNAKYLIFDFRKNTGGFDNSAEPIYSLVGEAEYWTEVPQIYASDATITSWKEMKKNVPDAHTQKLLNSFIQKMELKKNNWVDMMDNKEISLKISKDEIKATPQKVTVLIDDACGSSCEEVVKTIRQNPRVITIGRNTYGVLDASNIREVTTPSKKISLNYATTYVHRRVGQEIDGVGIPPRIKLPKPNNPQEYDDEVKYAQDYLEQEKWK